MTTRRWWDCLCVEDLADLIVSTLAWINDYESPAQEGYEALGFIVSVWMAKRSGDGIGTCDAIALLKLDDGKIRKTSWYATRITKACLQNKT